MGAILHFYGISLREWAEASRVERTWYRANLYELVAELQELNVQF